MNKTEKSCIIEAVDVNKTYDMGSVRLEALQRINLKIDSGEMVAIMGASGCGKTTLLNCLSSLDEITSGKVIIEGQDLSSLSENERSDLRAKKMGFVFQSYNLLPVLTALENVELPLMIHKRDRRAARADAMKSLEMVGLSGWEHHKPSELSGGQQQRVTLARSLVNNPVIVWADEPTGNLDSTNSKQIMDILCKLNEDLGQTYIIVTHDAKIASRAKRILKMKNGHIVRE